MSAATKTTLVILGLVTAAFLVSQLVLGQLILGGRVNLIKTHQHTGYTTVALGIVYLVLSLRAIASLPTRSKP